jgi:tetratricopeptide (TPR) repeat protein
MGITDWFHRRATSSQPVDLLAALIDAAERDDARRLMDLINENSARIKAEFKAWTKVQEPIRGDPAALGHYANTLITVAALFERSGDPSLRDLLEGRGRDNPLSEWANALERTDRLVNDGKAAEAIPILRASLDQIRSASGTGVTHYYPRTLGRLGLALSQVGDKDEAIRLTREARDFCRRSGDAEGVRTYALNLEAMGAPDVAIALSDSRFHVVFLDADGRILPLDEVSVARGTIRFEVRGGKTDPEAKRLHEEGRAAGAQGDHDAAITLFNRAARVDPTWPYPVYDRAFAHLIKQNFEAALADYRKVLELSPDGFFVAAVAVDLLTREASGEFPTGLYHAFAMLEHIPADQQREIVEQLVQKFPSHAPAWKLLLNFIADPTAKLTAIERGLGARPDRDTHGALLIRKALTLHELGQTESALELLASLAESRNSLATQAGATVAAALVR